MMTKPLHILSSVEIEIIPTDEVYSRWGNYSKFVERATKRSNGRYTPLGILYACIDGLMQLWVISDENVVCGVCVTEVNKHPGGLELNIVLLGGDDAERWKHLLIHIEEWGKEQGCKWAVAQGRRGLPLLLGDDWAETQYIFEKEL